MRGAIHRAGFPLESYSGQQMLEVISGLPARGAVQRHGGAAARDGGRRARVADRRAVRLFLRRDPYRRFLSCLVYLPARPVHDLVPAGDGRGAAASAGRQLGGVHRAGRRSRGLALVHFTVQTDRRRRRLRRGGRRGPAGRAHRGRPHLGRPAALRAGRGRRSPRQLAGCRRRTRRSPRPRGRWRTCSRIAALAGPVDFSAAACAPADGPAERAVHALPREHPGHPDRRAAGAAAARAWRSSTSGPPSSSAPTACAARSTTSAPARRRHPHRARRAARGRRRARSSARRSGRPGAATSRPTGSPRSCCARGCTWREVAVLRAYARYARQIGSPVRPALHGRHAARAPGRGRGAGGAVPGPVRPGAAGPRARRPRRRRSPRSRALIDAVTGLDADRILRGFLAMIMATLRTNCFRERPFLSFKIDPSQVPDMPAPRPAVRDLRVLAAGGGRAPAVRAGRPRRSALVGPARRTSAPRSSAWSRRRR